MTSSGDDIIAILSKLDEDDIFNLAKTVTQGLLKFSTVDDAVRGIIKYSSDTLSILRRKVVTREILFAYLDEKNIRIRLPATKNDLIDKVVEYWTQNQGLEIDKREPNQEQTSGNGHGSQEISSDSQPQENNVQALATQFAQWFYTLFNAEGVGPEHFFSDVNLKLNLMSSEECDSTLVENDPNEVAQTLLRIKLQHNLFFNPNVSNEGIQGRMDNHGLVIVIACGTLHIQNTCSGVFEQVFALARDPFCDNNWKIKNSELNLKSKSGILGQPRLCDSEFTSKLMLQS